MSSTAKTLWLRDQNRPLRWTVLPVLKLAFSALLHLTWWLKRLPLPSFRAHKTLQRLICWFCDHFVSYEANILILRHFATESNLLNFIIANGGEGTGSEPVALYPTRIADMMEASFVAHDQELFRFFTRVSANNIRAAGLKWDHWRNVDAMKFQVRRRKTQILDFETAHVLFMCLFCLLLTGEEYEGAINGFNLDQSVAIRIERITGTNGLSELSYNKYPLFLTGPGNLHQRFLMHGFFTENLNAFLQQVKDGGPK